MSGYLDKVLCAECGELVTYKIRTRKTNRVVNGISYEFNEREAVCDCCGQLVMVPGLDDDNESAFERLYREKNGYIQIYEIEEIIKKYNIEKRPLSKVLGMGEHTIERYLEGQLPNKKYSDELVSVLNSSNRMKVYYEKFKGLLTDKASEKLQERLNYYEAINCGKSRLEMVALYILNSKYEITNMSLQKLLYYVEAFGELFLGENIYDTPAQAWMYGPVYRSVYNKFQSFGGSPIIVEKKDYRATLGKEVVDVIDYVLDHFGMYNGTTLKEFTHLEKPWLDSHSGYGEKEPCEEIISHESIKEYFEEMNHKYHLTQKEGVEKYIASLFERIE